jgi:hypothetical protein
MQLTMGAVQVVDESSCIGFASCVRQAGLRMGAPA